MNVKKKMLNFIRIFRPIYVPVCTLIRRLFSNTSIVFCTCKFIRRISNPNFRSYLSQYRNPVELSDPALASHPIINMPVHVLGPKNKGKVIMLLENQTYHGGFCAIWIYYLNRLSFSDKMGLCHVINWNQSDFYQEDHPVNGAESVFEYYFQQPCGISLAEARESACVVYDWNNPEFGYDDVFHVGGATDYRFTSEDIEKFAKIQRKYIKLHPKLQKSIDAQIERLFCGHKVVLGVHARGADTKIGYKNHPLIVTAEDYIEKTEELAKRIKAELIFLATDDQEMLELFRDRFGDKLIYYDDVVRSSSTVMSCFIKKERTDHHYLLGLEIIRDVYTLAACQGFVCGMSYVGMVVQVLKRANNQKFRAFYRIFKGLRKDGIELTDSNARKKISDQWNKELNQGNDEKEIENENN